MHVCIYVCVRVCSHVREEKGNTFLRFSSLHMETFYTWEEFFLGGTFHIQERTG